jgi:hypothetical protein
MRRIMPAVGSRARVRVYGSVRLGTFRGIYMESPATGAKSAEQGAVRHEDRNCWIYTAYAICGIVFFGVLAYYASVYFAK